MMKFSLSHLKNFYFLCEKILSLGKILLRNHLDSYHEVIFLQEEEIEADITYNQKGGSQKNTVLVESKTCTGVSLRRYALRVSDGIYY